MIETLQVCAGSLLHDMLGGLSLTERAEFARLLEVVGPISPRVAVW